MGILQNYNLLRYVRSRRPHRMAALPQTGGAAPAAYYDNIIKQPFNAATVGVILPVGGGGSWDSFWVAMRSVVLASGTYYHFYHGSTDGSAFKIGLATSSDGETLNKSGSNPILSGTASTWDVDSVLNPLVWIEGSTWHMIYEGRSGSTYGLGHATSSDGTTWTKDSANPVLSMGSGWDSALVSTPGTMLKLSNVYYLYYWGGSNLSDQSTFAIGLATSVSPSGPWMKHGLNPLLTGTGGGSWDAGVLDPSIVIRDGVWYMLYQGNTADGVTSRISMAWSLDGLHWVRDTNNPRTNPRSAWFDSAWGGETPTPMQVGSLWYLYWSGSNAGTPRMQSGFALWVDINTPLSTLYTNLVAQYQLNNTVQDSLDGGRHGSATGTSNGSAGSAPDGSGTALSFNSATPSYVTLPTNTAFDIGTGDWCIGAWVKLSSKGATRVIAAKYNPTAGGHEWFLDFNNAADRYLLGVSTDGSADTTVAANNYGSPATGAWTFILAWVDRTANTINICVNDGTVNSVSLTFTAQTPSIAAYIGIFQTLILGWNGSLAQVCLWKSATAGGAIPTTTQRTWLYNSGSGRTYKELPTAP